MTAPTSRVPHPLLPRPSQEAVSAVLAEVRSCLCPALQALPCYLFFTPPRTTLDPSISLAAAQLTPAATLVLGWERPLPPALAAADPHALLAPHAQELLAASHPGAAPADATLAYPAARGARPPAPKPHDPPGVAGPSGVAPGAGSEASRGGGADGERKVPKWLKR